MKLAQMLLASLAACASPGDAQLTSTSGTGTGTSSATATSTSTSTVSSTSGTTATTHGTGTSTASSTSGATATTASTSSTSSSISGTITGYDGTITINSAGVLVNGSGAPIQLRGANMAGLDSQAISGYWDNNPWGQLGDIGTGTCGPDWLAYQTWHPNVVRIPLNSQSFLGLSPAFLTGTSLAAGAWGSSYPADPGGLYRATILAAIQNARAIGVYIIFDLHWAAPQFTIGRSTQYLGAFDQPPFIDDDSGTAFWTAFPQWLQQNAVNPATGTINDILFELFNEPYFANHNFNLTMLDGGIPPSIPGSGGSPGAEFVMKNGGYCDWYYQQGDFNALGRGIPPGFTSPGNQGGTGLNGALPNAISLPWKVAGYQPLLNAIRALGATNVILVNGDAYATMQSTLQYIYPTDTLNPPQVATGWHAYETGNSGYPGTGDPLGTFGVTGTAMAFDYPNATIAGTGGVGYPVPVIVTETGDLSGPSAPQPDVYIQTLQNWADTNSGSLLMWMWTGPASYGETSDQTWVEAIAGTPTTFTASISGTTMTVTSVSGTPLVPGYLLTDGPQQGTYVVSQQSGMPRGVGSYTVSIPQTVASTMLTGSALIPWNGQGQTNYDWMVNHP